MLYGNSPPFIHVKAAERVAVGGKKNVGKKRGDFLGQAAKLFVNGGFKREIFSMQGKK